MALGNNKEMAENKIILLYIINKISLPISNLHITKLVLENKYMNYFFLQQFLNELCENGFLNKVMSEEKEFYNITESGKQTLSYFLNMIPFGIKAQIDSSSLQLRKDIKNETLITADFTPKSENEFIVSCKVHEDNFSLIDLEVTVGSKADARFICDNWKRYSQNIYPEIIESLTKKRE